MVSMLDSRSSSLGLSPGRSHINCTVFLDKTLHSCSAVSTQVYKWPEFNKVLGGGDTHESNFPF